MPFLAPRPRIRHPSVPAVLSARIAGTAEHFIMLVSISGHSGLASISSPRERPAAIHSMPISHTSIDSYVVDREARHSRFSPAPWLRSVKADTIRVSAISANV
jgi:hypothetical protein